MNAQDQRRVTPSYNNKNEGRSPPKEGCARPQYVHVYSSEDLAEVFED